VESQAGNGTHQTRAKAAPGRTKTAGLTSALPHDVTAHSCSISQPPLLKIEPVGITQFVNQKLEGFLERQKAREQRRKKARQSSTRKPSTKPQAVPSAVLESITLHRLTVHHTDLILTLFSGCAECARLEALYGQALEYHLGKSAAAHILARRERGTGELRKAAGGAA
jgi:hypothetical protein